MLKCIPAALLACALVAAAPKPSPPGPAFVSHQGVGKYEMVRLSKGVYTVRALTVTFEVKGDAGEEYQVEVWAKSPHASTGNIDNHDPKELRHEEPHLLKTETVKPAGGAAKGKVYRHELDREPRERDVLPTGVFGWDYRLVLKKAGKAVAETGWTRVPEPPVRPQAEIEKEFKEAERAKGPAK